MYRSHTPRWSSVSMAWMAGGPRDSNLRNARVDSSGHGAAGVAELPRPDAPSWPGTRARRARPMPSPPAGPERGLRRPRWRAGRRPRCRGGPGPAPAPGRPTRPCPRGPANQDGHVRRRPPVSQATVRPACATSWASASRLANPSASATRSWSSSIRRSLRRPVGPLQLDPHRVQEVAGRPEPFVGHHGRRPPGSPWP